MHRSVGDGVVPQPREPAARVGAQPHVLAVVLAQAHHHEHLLPREHVLDRPLDHARGQHREHGVVAREDLAAEAAAHERAHHAYVLAWNLEGRCNGGGGLAHHLQRVMHRHLAVALPHGHGGVHLHRVVVLDGRVVHRVDGARRGLQALVDVAAPRVGLVARVDGGRRVGVAHVGIEADARLGRVVAHLHQRGRMARLLDGLGHHKADELAVVVNDGVLQQRRGAREAVLRRFGRGRRHLGHVLVREHQQHAGRFFCRRGVDVAHPPGRYRAAQ